MVNLEVDAGGLVLKNPVVVESAGYIVDGFGLRRMIKTGASAVVTKSNTWKKFEGGPAPRCYWYDDTQSAMNGDEALLNPGYKYAARYIRENRRFAKENNTHIIASFSPRSPEEAASMAAEFEAAGASAVHMDLQCPTAGPFRSTQYPNEDWDHLGSWWSEDPSRVRDVTKAVKEAVDIPVWPKPLLFRFVIHPEAIEVMDSANPDLYAFMAPGAPRLYINIHTGKPMAGPAAGRFRTNVRLTADLARLTKTHLLPSGGIATPKDAIEIIMAGANLVGICTAIYRDINSAQKLVDGITDFMVLQQFTTIEEMRGISLKYMSPKPGPESDYYNIFVSKYIRPPVGDYEWGGMVKLEEETELERLEEAKKPVPGKPTVEIQTEL
jgi:dihydroorotate dehydrogenase (NAD+) catalytic subunit